MVTNTFKINGVLLSLQPSDHGWVKRTSYGFDGGGHSVLPAMSQYYLSWDLMSPSEFAELVSSYNLHGVTGTCVVDLPQWGNVSGTFYAYSGCVLDEPEYSSTFENYVTDARLLIVSVRI